MAFICSSLTRLCWSQVRPGQILFEIDRVPRNIALQAMESIQAKFPCKLGFVEWS